MRKAISLVSLCVAVTAAVIGTVGRYRPELFLRIPNVGFVFWVLTGNRMPPLFDTDVFDEQYFHRWAKDGDCVFASGPKTGSIWITNIIHLLRTNGDDNFTSLMTEDDVGTSEMLRYPESRINDRVKGTEEKRKRLIAKSTAEDPFRGMTHFSHADASSGKYGLNVTAHPKIKYIASMRNMKEIARSFHGFLNGFTPEFRKLWGGFPPPMSSPLEGMNFVLKNKQMVFGHALGWWKLRHEPNVMLVHYSDLKKDLRGGIKRIAEFLDIPLSEELLEDVAKKSSFANMKRRQDENPATYNGLMGRPGQQFVGIKDHVSKGKNDGARDFFTTEMDKTWEESVQKSFGEHTDLLIWLEKGGSY